MRLKLKEAAMTDEEKKKLHTDTINTHISIVRDLCHRMGIPELGDHHDDSKFSDEEFGIYKWADGRRSPHDNARDALGASPSWIHHKANNPHHWEYFTDFNEATPNGDGTFTIICRCVKMPYDRVIEMFCDFVGAGKAYDKDNKWTTHAPLDYWNENCEGRRAMHEDSYGLIKMLLTKLSKMISLEAFVDWYNKNKDQIEKEYNL